MNRKFNNVFGKLFWIHLLFLSLSTISFAQNNASDNLKLSFQNFQENVLQEKIFVHTDKDTYATGENLWFKIYLLDATSHQLFDISKVVYVELLDANNQAMLTAKVEMKDGLGNGSFELPKTLLNANYKFRAYTNWMKNFSVDYYFEKNINIYNTTQMANTENLVLENEPELVLFPEGGNLVNQMESKVAFRISQHGIGLEGNGFLLNQRLDTIARFSPNKFGIGTFSFKPEFGQLYKAEFQLNKGAKISKNIGEILDKGTLVHVKESENEAIKVIVSSNVSSKVSILVHTRGLLKFIESAKVVNGKAEFLVNKKILGDGISQITIFDQNLVPVCERLYFKYPEKIFDLELKLNKKTFKNREELSLEISHKNLKKSAYSQLSMSVYKIDSLQNLGEQNINNYVWLTSDLKGDIESPDFYFNNSARKNTSFIDNLMLTHGWRRFSWEAVFNKEEVVYEYIPEFAGHIVNGKITKLSTGLPEGEVEAYLSIAGTQTQFKPSKSDSLGKIHFELPNFYNQGEIITQIKNTLDAAYALQILSPFSDKFSSKSNRSIYLNENLKSEFSEIHKSTTLQFYFSESKMPDTSQIQGLNSPFYSKPDISYLMDDYVRFPTIEEVLREFVRPVFVRKKEGNFQILTYDETHKKFFENNSLILLDGVPVADIDHFLAYNPVKIKKLELVTRPYYFGNTVFEGILNFTSYKGDLPNFKLDPNTTIIDYPGLQIKREFYMPQASKKRLPDFRNTLFWSPNIDCKSKVQKKFYTSDVSGNFVIAIQGVSSDGQTTFASELFNVKGEKTN